MIICKSYNNNISSIIHHSSRAYEFDTELKEGDSFKWQGSFIHYPIVPEPISVTNLQILKTVAVEGMEGNKTDAGSHGVMKFFSLSAESSEVVKLYRRHLRIDIKHYLKGKFGKHLYLIPNEAFEC